MTSSSGVSRSTLTRAVLVVVVTTSLGLSASCGSDDSSSEPTRTEPVDSVVVEAIQIHTS